MLEMSCSAFVWVVCDKCVEYGIICKNDEC